MNKLLGEGYKKELGIEDLYEVRQEDRSAVVGDKLERFVNEVHWVTVLILYLEPGCQRSKLTRNQRKLLNPVCGLRS